MLVRPPREKRKFDIVEVGHDAEIIRLVPSATSLMGDLSQAIVVVLERTCLVTLAVDGHVGRGIQMKYYVGSSVCHLLTLAKECAKTD
jgi:hypothetical protein|eukprot:evm.model.NODE_24061_length_13748_cov_26.966177.1